jgi:hypothetical protein
MGLTGREIAVTYHGHEIALTVGTTGAFTKAVKVGYKLHIDGCLVDQHTIGAWEAIFGGQVVLRGQLPPVKENGPAVIVKLVANLRFIRRNDYQLFVDGQEIHRERASFAGF